MGPTSPIQLVCQCPQRQRVANIHHHREPDDLGCTVEITEGVLHLVKLWMPHLRMPHLHINPFLSDTTDSNTFGRARRRCVDLRPRHHAELDHRRYRRTRKKLLHAHWRVRTGALGAALRHGKHAALRLRSYEAEDGGQDRREIPARRGSLTSSGKIRHGSAPAPRRSPRHGKNHGRNVTGGVW